MEPQTPSIHTRAATSRSSASATAGPSSPPRTPPATSLLLTGSRCRPPSNAFDGGRHREPVKSSEVAGGVLGGEDGPAVAEAEDRDVAALVWIDGVCGSIYHQHGDRLTCRPAVEILRGRQARTDRRDGPNFIRQFQGEPNAHLPAVGVSDSEDMRGIDVERLLEIGDQCVHESNIVNVLCPCRVGCDLAAIIPVALVAVRINHNESVCIGKSVERRSRTSAKLLPRLARAVECN